jgi:uncharacterized protein (DUF1499 family)/heme/copper-type cytochrome/quinol oxidase subunit 4
MILAWLAFFDALVAIALAAAGIIAAHYDFSTPFFGFTMFAGGLLFAALALVIAIIAFIVMTFSPAKRIAMPRAIIGAVIALIVLAPTLVVFVTHRYPVINDITTDTKNPPEFRHAQQLQVNPNRDMAYNPAFGRVQEAAPVYQKLAPLHVDETPDDVYKKVEIIAGEIPDWQITSRDPPNRTLEGVATSALFHFKDDFVIQVRPAEGGASLVEMRSKSRDGAGDLGANYNRIESFFQLMRGSPRGVTAQ